MKKIVTLATATLLSLLVAGSADALAQRGNTSSGSSTRQSSTSSGSSTRQSAATSGSSTRQSGGSSTRQSSSASTSSQSGSSTRQRSGSSTRQSGSASTSSSSTRQSGGTSTSRQSGSSTARQNGGTATSSGSTSRQSTTSTSGSTRQSGSTDSGSSTRQSGTATSSGSSTRQSGTSTSSSSSTRQTGSTSSSSSTRQSGTATSSGSSTRQSGTATSGTSTRQSGTSGSTVRTAASTDLNGGVRVVSATDGTVRSNSNITKQGLGTSGVVEDNKSSKPADGGYKADKYGNYRDRAGNYRYGDAGQYRLDDHYNAFRMPPRDRGFIDYGRPGHFYADKPHYFGYRVERLPSRVRLVSYYGINYYLYNGVYYRPYGNTYVICRPPFGTFIDIRVGRGPFNRVRFSYYTNVYRPFEVNAIYLNNRTIAEQNRIIAENNAILARQNAALAFNSTRANSAYTLAAQLGLVQNYAGANIEYFYQDGVFYTVSGGRYQVIVPPAGALVDSLPDDYDVITLGGFELYKVDDTVYRLTLVDGIPYLEVLGQMYGSLANQYNFYGSY